MRPIHLVGRELALAERLQRTNARPVFVVPLRRRRNA
jgi:hypothetical protein